MNIVENLLSFLSVSPTLPLGEVPRPPYEDVRQEEEGTMETQAIEPTPDGLFFPNIETFNMERPYYAIKPRLQGYFEIPSTLESGSTASRINALRQLTEEAIQNINEEIDSFINLSEIPDPDRRVQVRRKIRDLTLDRKEINNSMTRFIQNMARSLESQLTGTFPHIPFEVQEKIVMSVLRDMGPGDRRENMERTLYRLMSGRPN